MWKWKSLSSVRLSATPWALQPMEFSRPDIGVGSPSPLQGIFLKNIGILLKHDESERLFSIIHKKYELEIKITFIAL